MRGIGSLYGARGAGVFAADGEGRGKGKREKVKGVRGALFSFSLAPFLPASGARGAVTGCLLLVVTWFGFPRPTTDNH